MTETQTPNPDCPDCAGTGFVPPFMDACTCELSARPPMVAEVLAEPTTAGAFTTDTAGAFAAPSWMPPLTSAPYGSWPSGALLVDGVFVDAKTDEPLEAAYDAVDTDDTTWICDGGSEHPGSQRTCTCVFDAEAANDAMVAAAEAGEPPFAPLIADAVWAEPSPAASTTWVATKKFATPAQTALLARLCAERDTSHPVVAHALGAAAGTLTSSQASKLIDAVMLVPADPTKKPARSNNYDGICKDCGGAVAAKAGTIRKIDGRWVTFHKDGDCLSAEAKAEMFAEKVVEPGLYKWDLSGPTVIYRVRKSRSSDRLYAEKVVVHEANDGGDKHVEFVYNAKAMAFLRRSNKLTWAEAREFGAAYGACVACGRTLSDSRSLVQGYGATCAGHYGWPTVTKNQAEAIIAGVQTWDDVISDLGVLTS